VPAGDAHRAHGNARLQPERGEGRAAGDPVGGEMELPLVAPDAADGRPVHVTVYRDGDAVADEQELKDGDVPAELAARDRARAEERGTERPERMAHAQVCETGDAEPVGVLEGANRGDRARADDGVDGPVVQALGAQGDLQP